MTAPTSDHGEGPAPAAGPPTPPHGWRRRQRPLRLERRLEFADYDALRDFLDQVADLSEETGIYPNQSFGRTYVNLTLFAEDGSNEISAAAEAFAERVDGFVTG
ncbi:MAG: 4a-hydroxytetrahydrobiopterin dehydratase [Thiohalocapsa sp.]|uniref:4a-hydroxytetrahydrobiopterin dehydratase n=1 Tax=Thiohalocapsa sp. TaxID=2497641 RepID=UPI0025E715A0|nr:4a-hydroxytetrahydrobiopterin dehydratase [Thiohalocapsa sp.]MCG6941264.1 4a-hydroxytetrahydrobiopterin dehydratase [Thiohalocapsa sp.]